MDDLQRRIRAARGEIPADLLLRHAQLVSVCSGECYLADVALFEGRIVGVSAPGGEYRRREERDLEGRWSCVPASSFETPFTPLLAEDLIPLLQEERVLGLAEMMNMPGVLQGKEQVLAKVVATLRQGLVVDSHAPGLKGRDLCAYVAAGIQSDHECTTLEEARERVRLGMWLMIREGSAARDLEALLPLVHELHPPRVFFVTDDRDPQDLMSRGHIDCPWLCG